MPDINPVVRINIDTVDEIEKLYGIGRKLAERIVSYRTTRNYFQSPEDLAKVDGVSLQLAITIAPHIDWQLPTEPVTLKNREWGMASLYFIAFLVCIWEIKNQFLPSVYDSINQLQMGIPNAWVFLLIRSALTIGIASMVLFFVLYIMMSLTRNFMLLHKLQKLGFFFVAVFLASGLMSGIGHAINYSLNNNWGSLINNAPYMIGIIGFVVVLFGMFPIMIVLWKPRLATNLLLARLYDISIGLGTLSSAWYIWENYENQPLWVSLASGIFGAAIISIGLTAIRIGHSYFFEIADATIAIQPSIDEISVWKKWINTRLPDPEQQKALKKALEEMHPPSRFNTFVYAVVFGAGGWLLLTALSAVIQWFIENILDKTFR